MNEAQRRATRTAGSAAHLFLMGALALGAGACRDGRNALAPEPALPGGGGGSVLPGASPPAINPGPPATPGVEGPSLGIVLVSKQPRYKLRGGEERIPARLHDLQAQADAPAATPAGKNHAGKAKSGTKSGTRSDTKTADQGPPEAPQVDMTLRIINRSKQRIDFWSDGDAVTVTLRLEGLGAVTAPMPVMHTMEMRPPKVVTLGPGETFDVPISKLEFGERGDSVRAYWTRPVDYSIVPSLETAVRPAWPSTTADGDGFGRVMLAGPPLRIHVDPN